MAPSARSRSQLFSRRDLIAAAAATSAGLLASGSAGEASGRFDSRAAGAAGDILRRSTTQRREALRLANNRPFFSAQAPPAEVRFPNGEASFSKALPHQASGRVDPAAFERLARALRSGDRADFERIPLGGYLKLAEPEAAFEVGLRGPEGPQVELAAPPHLDSREGALDQLELYWMSLLRDVHFADYADDLVARRAAEELGATPETLFRGEGRGDSAGPYLSQLLYLDVAQFPLVTPQRFRMPPPGIDYQVAWVSWLASQNGLLAQPMSLESEKRFVRTGRDLAEYVRRDFSYQAFLNAALILLRLGVSTDGGSLHKHSRTQASFSGFGSPLVLHLVATIAQPALRLCWYYKWLVHRRLRPEEWGGLLESPEPLSGLLFDSTLTDSVALDMVRSRNGSRLLPLAYPEGCPAHPSFPAGHAVVAGACATVLKAYFDESFEFPAAVEASADGLELIPRRGVRLSVGGEIDKLAANISFGRNFAGIHYRSDSVEGLRFGERLALDYLGELKLAAPSDFAGWSVRTFDGERVDIH